MYSSSVLFPPGPLREPGSDSFPVAIRGGFPWFVSNGSYKLTIVFHTINISKHTYLLGRKILTTVLALSQLLAAAITTISSLEIPQELPGGAKREDLQPEWPWAVSYSAKDAGARMLRD